MPNRIKEYLFIVVATAAAMGYGIVNDQITSWISWEYFYYGKSLEAQLGPGTPPDALRLHLWAAVIGMQATWWVGLPLGAAILLANNPRPGLPSLPLRRLYTRTLPMVLLITVAFGVLGGVLGAEGWLNWTSDNIRVAWGLASLRPTRYVCVYGVHLGGYVGGPVAAIVAVVRIVRERRRLAIPG